MKLCTHQLLQKVCGYDAFISYLSCVQSRYRGKYLFAYFAPRSPTLEILDNFLKCHVSSHALRHSKFLFFGRNVGLFQVFVVIIKCLGRKRKVGREIEMTERRDASPRQDLRGCRTKAGLSHFLFSSSLQNGHRPSDDMSESERRWKRWTGWRSASSLSLCGLLSCSNHCPLPAAPVSRYLSSIKPDRLAS